MMSIAWEKQKLPASRVIEGAILHQRELIGMMKNSVWERPHIRDEDCEKYSMCRRILEDCLVTIP